MLLGGQGDDVIHGGAGNDRLEENMVTGASGSDSLYGEGGDDFFLLYRDLFQLPGLHYLDGGEGDDWLLVGIDNAGVATVDGGDGNDRHRCVRPALRRERRGYSRRGAGRARPGRRPVPRGLATAH